MFEPPFAAAKVGIDAATFAAASSVAVSVAATDAANITSFQQASKQVGEMSLNSQLKFVVVFYPDFLKFMSHNVECAGAGASAIRVDVLAQW